MRGNARPAPEESGALADTTHAEEIVQLLTRYQRRLLAYIRSLIPGRADAEDVLQEVNLFVWRNAHEFQPGSNFGAWAYRIAHFHVLTWRKRQARSKVCFSEALVEQLAGTAAEQAERADDRLDALEECVRKLSTEDRELVRLRYEVGGTAAVLAERLGRTAKAVYHALNRAHLRLLACVQRALDAEARP